jgi:O-acetyl-ADP-ribose deacetylase (regulator of RNase III)
MAVMRATRNFMKANNSVRRVIYVVKTKEEEDEYKRYLREFFPEPGKT